MQKYKYILFFYFIFLYLTILYCCSSLQDAVKEGTFLLFCIKCINVFIFIIIKLYYIIYFYNYKYITYYYFNIVEIFTILLQNKVIRVCTDAVSLFIKVTFGSFATRVHRSYQLHQPVMPGSSCDQNHEPNALLGQILLLLQEELSQFSC